MKYVFTFKEINGGHIEIEADHKPESDEIIERILEGHADYNDTDFTDLKLVEVDGKTLSSEMVERTLAGHLCNRPCV